MIRISAKNTQKFGNQRTTAQVEGTRNKSGQTMPGIVPQTVLAHKKKWKEKKNDECAETAQERRMILENI